MFKSFALNIQAGQATNAFACSQKHRERKQMFSTLNTITWNTKSTLNQRDPQAQQMLHKQAIKSNKDRLNFTKYIRMSFGQIRRLMSAKRKEEV